MAAPAEPGRPLIASRGSDGDQASGDASACGFDAAACASEALTEPPSDSEAIAWTKPDATADNPFASAVAFRLPLVVPAEATTDFGAPPCPTLSTVMVSPAASSVERSTSNVVSQYCPAMVPQGLRI